MIRENFYKLRSHWNLTPDKLNQVFSEVKLVCWQCNKEIGNMKHVWWTCPRLFEFWKKRDTEITLKMGIMLNLTPESCLLHLYLGEKNCVLLNNLLLSAKLIIARRWKTTVVPTPNNTWMVTEVPICVNNE